MKSYNSTSFSSTINSNEVSSFGEFIRIERKKRRLSQAEFAESAGIALLTLAKIETSKTDASKLKSKVVTGLSKVLHLDEEVLRSFAKGESFIWKVVKICPSCWKPGTPPDNRWTLADSYFCVLCGTKLREKCDCGHPILLEAKFCINCGKDYSKF